MDRYTTVEIFIEINPSPDTVEILVYSNAVKVTTMIVTIATMHARKQVMIMAKIF